MNATTLGGCILVALAPSNALAFLLARLRPLNHPCGTNAGPLGKVSLKLWTTQASNPGLLFLTACVHIPDRSGGSPSHTHVQLKCTAGGGYTTPEMRVAMHLGLMFWIGLKRGLA